MSYCIISNQFVPANQMKKCVNKYGRKMLVAQEVKTYKCANCGREVYLFDRDIYLVDGAGNALCRECIDNFDFTKCCVCHTWHKTEEMSRYEMWNGNVNYVCDEHKEKFEQDIVQCSHCQSYMFTDEYFEVEEECYCESCYNELYRECDICGEVFPRSDTNITQDGYVVCDACIDRTYECDICHHIFRYEDDLEFDEHSGEMVCSDCRESQGIHYYSYKPVTRFKRMPYEAQINEYFGLEIEVCGNPASARQFLKELDDEREEMVYLKRDSSIGGDGYGFEIVTHPMTREYFMKEFAPKLEKGMAYLKSKGFKGHNSGGIHIHVSQKAIDHDMFSKMFQMMYQKSDKNYKLWLAITQRKHNNMEDWASMNLTKCRGGSRKTVIENIKRAKALKYDRKSDIGYSRYMAINTQNENTIEFRIFNSSLRIERIIKNAQVIFALIDFTKTKKKACMKNFLKFIEDNRSDYKELYDFLIEKHIYIPELSMERLQELSKDSGEEMQKYIASLTAEQNLVVDENDEEIA